MSQLSRFPEFQTILPDHKDSIRAVTLEFPPYADFSFVNLLCWSEGKGTISTHNGNVVSILPHYDQPGNFISFLGDHQVEQTALDLLAVTEQHNADNALRLVPEVGALALKDTAELCCQEEPNQADYILSLELIKEARGKHFANVRNASNKYAKEHETQTTFGLINLEDPVMQHKILEVFLARETVKPQNDHQAELQAIERLFRFQEHFDLQPFGLWVGDKLAAFIVCELDRSCAIAHFWKADTSFAGVYQYFLRQVADALTKQGYGELNFQQDLGIEGLKTAKRALNPVHMLKKYCITKSSGSAEEH